MTFAEASARIKNAIYPEDIFDNISTIDAAYKTFAFTIHPDRNFNSAESVELFKKLGEFFEAVNVKIKSNTYGVKALGTVTKKGGNTYTLIKEIATDTLANTYTAETITDTLVCKIFRNPATKDFSNTEAETLKAIYDSRVKDLKIINHLPKLRDTFQLETKQQVSIFNTYGNCFNLVQVKEKYKNGIELKHAAWMFNRMLGALLAVHQAGFTHNALTPESFWIFPEDHNGLLTDFAYSVKVGENLKGYKANWKSFYAPELLEKHPSSFGSDIYMAINNFVYLLGDSNLVKMPNNIQYFVKYCKLGKRYRPQDTWELHNEFRDILKNIFGEPKFHEFRM